MQSLIEELTATVDPVALTHRIVEQTRLLVPSADGAAVCLRDHDDNLVIVAANGVVAPQLGRVVPVDETFSGRAARSGRPELCRDVATDPRLPPEVRALGHRLAVRSTLCIPLNRGDTAIGVLAVSARAPHAFVDDDVASLASMSGFLSAAISANTEMAWLVGDLLRAPDGSRVEPAARFVAGLVAPEAAARERLRDDVEALALPGHVGAVFQPIVALTDLRVHALEALCRFPDHGAHGPDRWFTAAHRVDRGIELELRALRAMLDAAREVPERYLVGVNLSPRAALDPTVQETLLTAGRGLIVELTEHEPAPERIGAELAPLRARGLRLAVDDAGAGFAGLTHILRLRPDVLKLDRELTAGIEHDPVRRALATALVTFAGELGALAVAEGIETEEQFVVLRDLGIHFGQGFWLCPPRPLGDLLPALPRLPVEPRERSPVPGRVPTSA